jgi:hypothetical protein
MTHRHMAHAQFKRLILGIYLTPCRNFLAAHERHAWRHENYRALYLCERSSSCGIPRRCLCQPWTCPVWSRPRVDPDHLECQVQCLFSNKILIIFQNDHVKKIQLFFCLFTFAFYWKHRNVQSDWYFATVDVLIAAHVVNKQLTWSFFVK